MNGDGESPLVSVVVPVFNEEASLPELRKKLFAALGEIDAACEVVFVDDGSTDRSAEMLERWARSEDGVVLVQLSRNFGMEIAMSAGLDHARGDHVVLMHADLQDPPELIPEMLKAAESGADVVYARRIGREESRVKRIMATGFYATMRRLARVPYQGQAGDFRLMSRRVADAVRDMPERRRFLRGMVAWVGFEQVPIDYRRTGRRGGRGASYPALFRLAAEALTSFSDVPLSLATYVGVLAATVSGVATVTVLVLTVLGVLHASIGVWILVAVLFLGGAQLISVGVLGRYLAHVHDQVLQRPLYLVTRVVSRHETSTPAPAARP
jgi:polyisoprenyl-phosphate glycosyltransferase